MSEKFFNLLKEHGISLLSKYTRAKDSVLLGCSQGHTWKVIPSNTVSRGNGLSCKICYPDKKYNKKTTEEFVEELFVLFPEVKLVGEYKGAREYVELSCSMGHTWKTLPTNIVSHNSGGTCQVCNPTNVSKGELELLEFIRSQYSGWIETNVRGLLIQDLEVDVVLPDAGICFEYNGTYFHSEGKRGSTVHKNKCDWLKEEYEYTLIQIWDTEWNTQKDLVKSRIKSVLGTIRDKVPARKCTIREISFPSEFLRINHIQGAGAPTKYNYGLFFKEELIAVMTFGVPRFSTSSTWELVRYCSLMDISVIGGASKLLKAFRREHSGSIVSYSDRRWSSGNLYKQLGFIYSHSSGANYKYYKGATSLSRYLCQKHKLKDRFPNTYSDSKTEREIMNEEGYYAVYDAGNDVWILE